MTDTSDRDGLSPLARALSSVFDESEEDEVGSASSPNEASGDGEDQVRETATPDAGREAAQALKASISAYLTSPEGDARNGAADQLREAYAEAERRDLVDELADALSALARLGGSRPEALRLAREIATPEVVRQLVIRAVETPAASRADRVRLLRHPGELSVRVLVDEEHRDPAEQIGGLRERRAMVDMLLEIGPDSPHVISEMMEDDRWYVVRNGVQVLGEAGLPDGLQHLTGTVAHEDARVRRASVVALQQIGGDAAGLLALARLDDEDASVRAAAARAVGALRAGRGVRQLLALLEREGDDDVIVAACRALGDYRDPSAVTALEKKATGSFFSKSPTEIRIAAYRALAAIGTPKAQQLLIEAANDKDSRVRSAVRASLRPRG